jgi:hypothetical protein
MQEAHSHGPNLALLELRRNRSHLLLVEFDRDRAVVEGALAHTVAQAARHQGFGLLDKDVIHIVAVLGADGDRIAEALRGQEGRSSTPAFDQGVSDQRRAVDDRTQLTSLDIFPLEQLV